MLALTKKKVNTLIVYFKVSYFNVWKMLSCRRSVTANEEAQLTTVNKIHQIQHNYFSHHSGFMEIVGLLSPHTLQTSGKMVCVCVCVEWGECCYYSMCENEMALHLANRTSYHLVETEACHLENGKGRAGNAAKESSPHCSWSAENRITRWGYIGKWFAFWLQSIQLTSPTKTWRSVEWNHWLRRWGFFSMCQSSCCTVQYSIWKTCIQYPTLS